MGDGVLGALGVQRWVLLGGRGCRCGGVGSTRVSDGVGGVGDVGGRPLPWAGATPVGGGHSHGRGHSRGRGRSQAVCGARARHTCPGAGPGGASGAGAQRGPVSAGPSGSGGVGPRSAWSPARQRALLAAGSPGHTGAALGPSPLRGVSARGGSSRRRARGVQPGEEKASGRPQFRALSSA